jgi:hypothetical protein
MVVSSGRIQVKLNLAIRRQHMQAACFGLDGFALQGMYLEDAMVILQAYTGTRMYLHPGSCMGVLA